MIIIIRIPEFTQLTHEQYHDPSRHKHGCLLRPSRSGILLLFPPFFLYVCHNITPQCCKENIISMPRTQCLQNLRWPKVCAALKNPTWRPAGHSPLRFATSRDRLHASRSGRSAAQRSVACNRSCDSTVVSCPSSIFVLRCWAWCCGEASLRREFLPKLQMDGHQ